MKKLVIVSMTIIILMFLSGCTQNSELNSQIETLQRTISEQNEEIKNLQTTLDQKDNTIFDLQNKIIGLNKTINYCEKNSDCILKIAGCKDCPSCKQYKLTDPEIIAVNKNLYRCAPKPADTGCVACVDGFDFDPQNDVVCLDNRCVKK